MLRVVKSIFRNNNKLHKEGLNLALEFRFHQVQSSNGERYRLDALFLIYDSWVSRQQFSPSISFHSYSGFQGILLKIVRRLRSTLFLLNRIKGPHP